MISKNSPILLFLLMAASIGCTKIPCYPPEHYAPEPTAPYKAEEVQVSTPPGHILAGTLTLPTGSNSPYPAIVMITGSGLQDRDHMQSRQKPVCYYKPFRQLADTISRRGLAVLRMDDQGVGCSEGGPLENVTIQERANDIRSGIEFLLYPVSCGKKGPVGL